MSKKVGIVGYGYVGKAMYNFFKDNYETFVYDVEFSRKDKGYDYLLQNKSDGLTIDVIASKDKINECDLAVICVPTPMNEDGTCDISIVEDVVSWVNTPLVLLKSTVSVGTTNYLVEKYNKNIVFSPEYCGESSYWSEYKFHTDIKETPFFIFGGDSDSTSEMVDYFLPITGPTKIYKQTDAKSAEVAKYMENTFYATKIAFCYEVNEMCEHFDVDYNEARELWLLDPRINKMHTAVFKGNERPWHGKCLPKDLSAFIKSAVAVGYNPELLMEVWNSNERIGKVRREKGNNV
jgi:nucleotide sugar dehydrogenase